MGLPLQLAFSECSQQLRTNLRQSRTAVERGFFGKEKVDPLFLMKRLPVRRIFEDVFPKDKKDYPGSSYRTCCLVN